jgi:CDP-diacylglycerol--serine O-phosphatidyltransferase
MSRGKGRRKFKKGVFILPSIFTSLNLFCAFYSITASLEGHFLRASWAIIIAAAFDAVDGRIARLTHSVSKFGEEYDSLVDMVSFGIAPALMIYVSSLQMFGRWGWLAAFLFVICVALRLARFNVHLKFIDSKYFQGLPSPPSAGMLATTVIFLNSLGILDVKIRAIPVLTCLLALLMVSNIRYYSFKDFNFRKRRPFSVLVALVLILVLLLGEPEIILFGVTALYSLSGPFGYLIGLRQKKGAAELVEESKYY